MPHVKSVVIVGAGMAGQSCAATLRDRGFDGPIHLVGAEAHLPYDRPPLSKEILSGEWETDRIVLQPEDWYRDRDITLHLGETADAIAIDSSGETDRVDGVQLAGGTRLDCDAVLIATGGRPRRPPIPGIGLERVHVLRNLDDVSAIRRDAAETDRAVVIGAGFIGAEGAASLRKLGLEVAVVELASQPMEQALGAEVGAVVARIHREEGTTVICSESVEEIAGDSHVAGVVTASGERIDAGLVVVGVGIEPRVELGRDAGCDIADGIVVDEYARTTVSGIYAAGDVAEFPSSFAGRRLRVEHYNHAIAHGATAAATMTGALEPLEEVPWFWSDQYDVNFQYAGLSTSWDEIIWTGDPGGREFAAFYVEDGSMRAAFVANSPRVMRGARKCFEAGIDVGADELRDPDLDLRKLAKQRS